MATNFVDRAREPGDIPPSFIAGTTLLTPEGERAVETLGWGDLVTTLHEGALPVRDISRLTVEARGAMAPVRIAAGAMGNVSTLVVAPRHRVLLTGWRAELHCGTSEALVAAADLVNGRTVTFEPEERVTYVCLMLEQQGIVLSNGMATELGAPGDWALGEADVDERPHRAAMIG